MAALRGWVEDAVRKRGRGGAGPLSELPAPLPLSRFQWPIGMGKGVRAGYEKCGMCLHCTRPQLRKGCLNPTIRQPGGLPEAAAATAGKLQVAVNYALRAERELHALADGAWDGPDASRHRAAWASRVRRAPPFCSQVFGLPCFQENKHERQRRWIFLLSCYVLKTRPPLADVRAGRGYAHSPPGR